MVERNRQKTAGSRGRGSVGVTEKERNPFNYGNIYNITHFRYLNIFKVLLNFFSIPHPYFIKFEARLNNLILKNISPLYAIKFMRLNT